MDYSSQRLSAAETSAVASHLVECADCRRVLDEERQLGLSLAAVPLAVPRRDLLSVVQQRRAESARRRPSPWRDLGSIFSSRPLARLAFAPAAAAAVAVVLLLSPGRPPMGNSVAMDAATAITQTREASMQNDDPLSDFSDRTWEALSAQSGRS
jgi:hypothetical protein